VPSQYSQYAGAVVATPQKSSVPLSTIGGEPGGRAPIVVQDKFAQVADAPPPQNDHTSVVVGMPEPGRDIFAGEPAKGIKSEIRPSQPPPPQKEISSVISEQTTTSEPEAAPVSSLESTSSSSAKAASHSNPDTTSPPEKLQDTTDGDSEAKDKLAGPVGEAEAEADRAAKELYPDADKM
jgi:dolichyl-phosphate-mannose-protein mannosyltransferase